MPKRTTRNAFSTTPGMAMTILNAEAAMAEWPQERRHRLSNPVRVGQNLTDIPIDLLREVEGTNSFTTLVQAVIEASIEQADPKTKLTDLSVGIDKPDTFGDYDETVRQVVLALA